MKFGLSAFLAIALFIAEAKSADDIRRIVFPELSIVKMPIEDALVYIASHSREHDPKKEGISLVICSLKVSSGSEAETNLISFYAKDISAMDAIDKIVRSASWYWALKGNTMYAWNYTQCPSDPLGYGAFDMTGTSEAFRKDPKAYLSALGMTFPPSSSVIFDSNSNLLVVRTTAENLDLAEQIINYMHAKVEESKQK